MKIIAFFLLLALIACNDNVKTDTNTNRAAARDTVKTKPIGIKKLKH